MAHVPTGLVSHSRKICNFYKRLIRHIESTHYDFFEHRYISVLIRNEFDKNKNIKDLRIAKDLLMRAEKTLYNDFCGTPKKFPNSPGGVAFEREHNPPDWLLDYWHPMEKAMYPKYFALREQRKKEYEEFYEKEYGKNVLESNNH